MAQNEMRAMRGLPLRVRSKEGLGACSTPTLETEWRRARTKWLIAYPVIR
jgi:hypothetical protein